jgi:transposase
MDEVHFQQYGSRIRMWIPPDTRDPIVLHHPTRKSVGYFGAVRLRDGRLVVRQERERFNAVTCWAFLEDLATASREPGRQVIVIADNARFHHAKMHQEWRAAQAETFRLDFLPPYSPELNPIERVWKLTRRLCLHNQYFATLEAVVESVESQFTQWATPTETLRRLCAII